MGGKMAKHFYSIDKMPVYLGKSMYSRILEECIKMDYFSKDDADRYEFADCSFSIKKKIERGIYKYLKSEKDNNSDRFINYIYNHSYRDEDAKDNIALFLDGVSCKYKSFRIEPVNGYGSDYWLLFGNRFYLKYGKKKEYTSVMIDVNQVECFWGSIDNFDIHFRNEWSIHFYHGEMQIKI